MFIRLLIWVIDERTCVSLVNETKTVWIGAKTRHTRIIEATRPPTDISPFITRKTPNTMVPRPAETIITCESVCMNDDN